ncbi:hypothetical protein DPMN_173300 [Dreissena polymorpha]|uniref:Helicase C-terminal domain-containing protein n=1 Tax=Dreissena polymorpha TaxID=45954 RepID=A0A9D4E1B4_DREPO|nr:hypothetical protein DPMN_173300 [Dreissena polymorpha]
MATVRQYDGDNAIERWRHCDDTTATVRYDYRIVAPQILGDEFYSGKPSEKTARVMMYHSSMEGSDGKLKKHIVETVQTERSTIRLIIASVALGMGADLRHVKRVIHAGPPTSLESKFSLYTRDRQSRKKP